MRSLVFNATFDADDYAAARVDELCQQKKSGGTKKLLKMLLQVALFYA